MCLTLLGTRSSPQLVFPCKDSTHKINRKKCDDPESSKQWHDNNSSTYVIPNQWGYGRGRTGNKPFDNICIKWLLLKSFTMEISDHLYVQNSRTQGTLCRGTKPQNLVTPPTLFSNSKETETHKMTNNKLYPSLQSLHLQIDIPEVCSIKYQV